MIPPEAFCNVDYPFSKELYTHDIDKPCKMKYGLEFKTDTTDCYAIHLWEQMTLNKHKIDIENESNIHTNSLWKKLTNDYSKEE